MSNSPKRLACGSPASTCRGPAGQDFIAAAIEAASGEPLGAPGTLAPAAALITALTTTP